MPISFPLPLADFFNAITIQSLDLNLNIPTEYSQDEGGNIYRALIGSPLWNAQVELSPALTKDADYVRSRINLLKRPDATLFVSPRQRRWPGNYETAAPFTGFNPTITTIATNRVEINLSGLPANAVLLAGDYLTVAFGSNPVRYSFHQIVTGRNANGSGVATGLEVVPYLPAGAAAGNPVTLVNPFFKAVLMESSGGRFVPKHNTGMSLRLQQLIGR